eukprot:s1599_g6.t3
MSSWNSFYGGYVDRREENARKRQTPAGSERQDRSERLVQQLKEQTALLAKSEAGKERRRKLQQLAEPRRKLQQLAEPRKDRGARQEEMDEMKQEMVMIRSGWATTDVGHLARLAGVQPDGSENGNDAATAAEKLQKMEATAAEKLQKMEASQQELRRQEAPDVEHSWLWHLFWIFLAQESSEKLRSEAEARSEELRTVAWMQCDFGSAARLSQGRPALVAYICSRYYRAPELIFGATNYTTAVDLWSIGCVLAEMLRGRPLFPGENGVDQLVEIVKVLGSPSRRQVLAMNPQYFSFAFPNVPPCSWGTIFRKTVAPEFITLLAEFLQYDPEARIKPLEACAHSCFDSLREEQARCPDGQPLPPDLFNLTQRELRSCSASLHERLVPAWHAARCPGSPPQPQAGSWLRQLQWRQDPAQDASP